MNYCQIYDIHSKRKYSVCILSGVCRVEGIIRTTLLFVKTSMFNLLFKFPPEKSDVSVLLKQEKNTIKYSLQE